VVGGGEAELHPGDAADCVHAVSVRDGGIEGGPEGVLGVQAVGAGAAVVSEGEAEIAVEVSRHGWLPLAGAAVPAGAPGFAALAGAIGGGIADDGGDLAEAEVGGAEQEMGGGAAEEGLRAGHEVAALGEAAAVSGEEAGAICVEFKELGLAAVKGGEQAEPADGGVGGLGHPLEGHLQGMVYGAWAGAEARKSPPSRGSSSEAALAARRSTDGSMEG